MRGRALPSLSRRRSPRHSRGFTLLEVLACLMLVAVVLPVAMRAISRSTQGGSFARSVVLATGLAESRLAELVADGSWSTGDAGGPFDVATWGESADRFAWELQVDDALGGTAKELRLTVTWTQFGRDEAVSLVTLAGVEDL